MKYFTDFPIFIEFDEQVTTIYKPYLFL